MSETLFTGDFKAEPWWWEAAPCPDGDAGPLPAEVDVLVVGAGYTGLHAALQTARAGRATLVLDAGPIGGGCSSRNGGQVSTSIKGPFGALAARHGRAGAIALLGEGRDALDFLEEFIETEGIDCDWTRCGRFTGAHDAASYAGMARDLEALPQEVAVEWHAVPRAEQHAEIGSDFYRGGIVFPRYAALHPARYVLGLLECASAAGAVVTGHCAVERIERAGAGFEVHTSRGRVRAGQVAIATNGYTGTVSPWLRRRVIPIGSYIIATEPLGEALAAEISPHARTMTDSRRLVVYYRLSPDRERVVFGGRVALTETDPRVSAPRLHAGMCRIWPQLRGVRISHSWVGFVAYTFDHLPHTGVVDGVHYAMGYCGSGVSLASWYGMRLGQRMCGLAEGRTALDDLEFQTRPLYSGSPWFLAPSILWYRLRDRIAL